MPRNPRAPAHAKGFHGIYAPRIRQNVWRTMSDVDKIKALFGISLDDMLEIMSIPNNEADLHVIGVKFKVFDTLMRTGLQLMREKDGREQNTEIIRQLERLILKVDKE